MFTIVLGSILFILGLLYLFREALVSRRLSDPHRTNGANAKPALEPRGQGLRFLGLGRNWPGLAMIVVGSILLISGAFV
ncbi:hypothetical protein [Rhizobium sp. LjRoot254]|uniref:hypothetical protein n=1 Tax=Rhizobium sp. LjRoot254 TaxID=3342297 RepID=UPI003ECDE775